MVFLFGVQSAAVSSSASLRLDSLGHGFEQSLPVPDYTVVGEQVSSVRAGLRLELRGQSITAASGRQHGLERRAIKVAGVVCSSVGQLTSGTRFCGMPIS